ncbi:hypothetical protein PUV54_03190 [Hyphococcus flavus]|uniref:Uncharacterized protein n=1 Tax=Hyphococcus flavus TaxID=1866326 RepID=A0AAE9ZJF4_9PROT|nr:hypothetical protein [Hyphococcus flavus]WDI32196.1 hypothetical protein PUV54_03190 [Hyphococcus flavus]
MCCADLNKSGDSTDISSENEGDGADAGGAVHGLISFLSNLLRD